jgi:hypothetical protein
MYQTHTDQNGNTKLVAELDDQHLMNIIRYIVRKATGAHAALGNITMGEFETKLYGLRKVSEGEFAEKINSTIELLYPYVFEAALRGFVINKELSQLVGRSTVLVIPDFMHKSAPLLGTLMEYDPDSESDFDEFDELDEDFPF